MLIKHLRDGVRDWLPGEEKSKQLTDISLEYSHQDLSHATGGFTAANCLGAGAAGAVYRGVLRGGTEVAVKVLPDRGGMEGFEDEVRVLSRFRHPNLVTLMGWGAHGDERYLVYELLLGGDVAAKLARCREGKAPFPWSHRLQICLDAACGLSHMVNSQPKAFHRDIKPANILVDARGTAKMADFGLAGTIQDLGRQHFMVQNISGTPGYACPLYIQTGCVNEQSEIYSFGIVSLELLLGLPPALAGPQGDIIYPLLRAVQPAAPGAHARVVAGLDQSAGWPQPVAGKLAELALSCVDMVPGRRPLFEGTVRLLRSLCACCPEGSDTPPHAAWDIGHQKVPVVPSTMNGGYFASPQRLPDPPANSGGGTGPKLVRPPVPTAGSAGISAAPQHPLDVHHQLAEIELLCICADGVDLTLLPAEGRSLVLPVTLPPPGAGPGWRAAVGRQHQPDLFEFLVPSKEQLARISRTQLVLARESLADALTLTRLSANALFVDDRPLAPGDTVPLLDRMRVGFAVAPGTDPRQTLVFSVVCRSLAQVRAKGLCSTAAAALQLGAGGAPQPQQPPQAPQAPPLWAQSRDGVPAAVLDCVKAIGADPTALPMEQRVIALPVDAPVEVGRQHQMAFFERLLQADPSWLSFISRTHCRVRLSLDTPLPSGGSLASHSTIQSTGTTCSLWIENLSANPVFVSGRPLGKGHTDVLVEGGKLAFVAKREGEETTFIEFTVRRPR